MKQLKYFHQLVQLHCKKRDGLYPVFGKVLSISTHQ